MEGSGIDEAGTSATLLRRLRPLIPDGSAAPVSGWRDDLRLFAMTWTIGFLFFLLLIA